MSLYLKTRGLTCVAVAVCDRCRMKRSITQLIADPNAPGLRVCADTCVDIFDPWRLPARRTEDITLRYPRPEEPLTDGSDSVEDDGYYPSPAPNSTPGLAPTRLTLTGVAVNTLLGVLTPSQSIPGTPGLVLTLTGNAVVGALGALTAIPSTVQLTGVQATGLISLQPTPITPTTVSLRGVTSPAKIGYFGGVPVVPTPPAPPTGFLNIINIIKGLQVKAGPYAGAYQYVQNGNGYWYYANVALISICQYLNLTDLDTYVRPYLDLYLARVNGNYTIDDVLFNSGQLNPSDVTNTPSTYDDNYAATFLSLVWRYLQASQNFAWWDTNKAKIFAIADNNLVNNLRADGMIAAFQYPRRNNYDAALLSNNCDDYAGLSDLAAICNNRGDTANYSKYINAKINLASAIDATLWVTAGNLSPGYKPDDLPTTQLSSVFVPYVVGQAYLQTQNLTELNSKFTACYSYVNTNAPGWENCQYDNSPWLVLGLDAALRGDTTRANKQLSYVDGAYTANSLSIGINELGMYQRIKSVLAGMPQS